MSSSKTRMNLAKKAQDIHGWTSTLDAIQTIEPRIQTSAMNTRTAIVKSRTTTKMTRTNNRRHLSKRVQALQHWTNILRPSQQQQPLKSALEVQIQPRTEPEFFSHIEMDSTTNTTATQTSTNDIDNLFDADVDIDDLEFLREDFTPSILEDKSDEDPWATIEEDLFADFDKHINSTTSTPTQSTDGDEDSLSDVDVDFDGRESIPWSIHQLFLPAPQDPVRPTTEVDFFVNFDTDLSNDSTASVSMGNLETLQQQLIRPLEAGPEPIIEEYIFAAFDARLGIDINTTTNTHTQPTNDDHSDSLSYVDVDLDDLESIPEDFVIPMLNEDGTPISDDSESDTSTDESNQPPTPRSPEDNIRNIIIAVQGDDTDVRMENAFFPTRSNRPTLANITITSAFRNENGGVVRTAGTAYQRRSIAAIRRQIAEFGERRRSGDHTARLGSRRHANQENVPPAGREQGTTEEQERERAWREERDSMIFGWDDGLDIGHRREERRVQERRMQGSVWRERRWTPYQESWTRHMR